MGNGSRPPVLLVQPREVPVVASLRAYVTPEGKVMVEEMQSQTPALMVRLLAALQIQVATVMEQQAPRVQPVPASAMPGGSDGS